VFPANSNAALPDEFIAHTVLPESPAQLDPSEIAANRERWIQEWVAVMEG
jgi:thiamine transport system substrate-binding protein